ncbi:MAG: hypothetical protein MJK14_01635 [Rivularia sp. ALOHA_DT_140]|nr:hypothetical protein [Rivularia sp. ALOHA_DT_140]
MYELGALETIPKEIKEKYPSILQDEFWSIYMQLALFYEPYNRTKRMQSPKI